MKTSLSDGRESWFFLLERPSVCISETRKVCITSDKCITESIQLEIKSRVCSMQVLKKLEFRGMFLNGHYHFCTKW